MATFKDKGDTFNDDTRTITCGSCSAESPYGRGFADTVCGCSRVLSGVGRSSEPDLS
ncbi:hypothetical protein ABGB18_42490 [Nonomuraea sp. B12E4]|uniref:hypothetical protein n=1 Tax=Nonomuraea sp. B12E4 TaxID=3153564 RepID=UPI00325CE328